MKTPCTTNFSCLFIHKGVFEGNSVNGCHDITFFNVEVHSCEKSPQLSSLWHPLGINNMEDNPLLSYNQQYNSALLECRCSVGLAQNVHFLCPHCYDVAIASFNKIFFCISNFVLGTYNCWHPTKTTNALDIHCSE